MSTFPKIIHQSWKTYEIPDLYKPWVDSWKKYNPDYQYVLYDDRDNRELVKNYYPQYLSVYDSFPLEIYRADFVRYLYLHRYGGIYADLDFECLNSFESLLNTNKDYDIILGRLNEWTCFRIPNAIMISKPGVNFWIEIINNILYRIETLGINLSPNKITGSKLLDDNVPISKDSIYVTDPIYFYNFSHYSIKYISPGLVKDFIFKLKRKEAIDKGAYAISYWTYSWKESWERIRDKKDNV